MDTLLFLALIPPDDIAAEVTAFKHLAAQRFHSKHALNAPAHITLQPPFQWPEDRLSELTSLLHSFSATCKPFSQELRDFDCFRPRVVFINIILNEHLLDLESRLKTALTPMLGRDQIDRRPYHPHMTVAFKDLRRREFYLAWEFFSQQTYLRNFTADTLWLLRHNGRTWEPVQSFGFLK